jgi:hypothetical protein
MLARVFPAEYGAPSRRLRAALSRRTDEGLSLELKTETADETAVILAESSDMHAPPDLRSATPAPAAGGKVRIGSESSDIRQRPRGAAVQLPEQGHSGVQLRNEGRIGSESSEMHAAADLRSATPAPATDEKVRIRPKSSEIHARPGHLAAAPAPMADEKLRIRAETSEIPLGTGQPGGTAMPAARL